MTQPVTAGPLIFFAQSFIKLFHLAPDVTMRPWLTHLVHVCLDGWVDRCRPVLDHLSHMLCPLVQRLAQPLHRPTHRLPGLPQQTCTYPKPELEYKDFLCAVAGINVLQPSWSCNKPQCSQIDTTQSLIYGKYNIWNVNEKFFATGNTVSEDGTVPYKELCGVREMNGLDVDNDQCNSSIDIALNHRIGIVVIVSNPCMQGFPFKVTQG